MGVNCSTDGGVSAGAGEGGNAGGLSHPVTDVEAAETAPGNAMVGAAEAASAAEKAVALVGGGIAAPPPPAEVRRRNGGGVKSGGGRAREGERKRAARLAGT
jgi:hypothetical protein